MKGIDGIIICLSDDFPLGFRLSCTCAGRALIGPGSSTAGTTGVTGETLQHRKVVKNVPLFGCMPYIFLLISSFIVYLIIRNYFKDVFLWAYVLIFQSSFYAFFIIKNITNLTMFGD